MANYELSKEYLEEHYINLGKTRYQISEETGVGPVRIGTMLQKYGIKRYSISRHNHYAHPLYNVWEGMRERCTNPSSTNYKWYGGNGISVCEEWSQFQNFFQWAIQNGWKKGLSIDRIDGRENYTPQNCRFVTHKEQCRNRRSNNPVTVNGVTRLQCEWEEVLGLRKKILSKWKHEHGVDYMVNRIKEEIKTKEGL